MSRFSRCPEFSDHFICLNFQVILYEKVPFGTSTKRVDYAGVLIFKCPHQQVPPYALIWIIVLKRWVCGKRSMLMGKVEKL